jgi:hypothetical protein
MKTLAFFAACCCFYPLCAQVEIDQSVILTGADGTRSIQQLEIPVNGTDAVNKDYVDNAVAAGGASMPSFLSDESPGTMNFGAAMRYCRNLSEGGFTDWRTPTYEELVYVYSLGENTIPNELSSNYFWLGDRPGAQYATLTSAMRLSDGYTFGIEAFAGTYRARCVR